MTRVDANTLLLLRLCAVHRLPCAAHLQPGFARYWSPSGLVGFGGSLLQAELVALFAGVGDTQFGGFTLGNFLGGGDFLFGR